MILLTQIKISMERVVECVPPPLLKCGQLGGEERLLVKRAAAQLLRIPEEQIHNFTILRRSMDARKNHPMQYIYQAALSTKHEEKICRRYGKNDVKLLPGEPETADVDGGERDEALQENTVTHDLGHMTPKPEEALPPVVAGMGPAGLFAALELAKHGRHPILLERGCDVDKRRKKVCDFWDTGRLDPDCNVQFGEGGAGTFSDGKLNTLVKDPQGLGKKVLETFVRFGAPSQILYLQKPHIGTDLLGEVVKGIREKILALGGEVWFETTLEDVVCAEGKLSQLVLRRGGRSMMLPCHTLILATGHSARDTITQLYTHGLAMRAKPFAVGVRVEHPQEMIAKNQYGRYADKLPAAEYKLTCQTKQGRGVYSFCMCPGGEVVNASSEPGRLAVNGMSNHARDGRNANSAIVVTVDPADFGGTDPLAGIAFQRRLEEAAFREGQGKIPVQCLGDFRQNKASTGLGNVLPAMRGGYRLANVRTVLPAFIGDSIAEGFDNFEKRISGFAREDAILSGVESRTSSPVRIERDETMQANIRGLYPCGEGAGYAGGITSAAMDGIRVARKILDGDYYGSKRHSKNQ